MPTAELTTLSSIPKRVKGNPGGTGKGTWMNGRNGEPIIIRVPIGTVIRELPANDPRRAKDEWESEIDALQDLSPEERVAKVRERRWVHYPGAAEDNLERDSFQEAERIFMRQERERRRLRREQNIAPLFLDLNSPITSLNGPVENNLEIGNQAIEGLGYLVAMGGEGGLGNPGFLTTENRSPKFATRGNEGQRITLSLELKILADVGLVGYPNAGKSTLLRAMTGGRAKAEVAGYAFTTLNPSVGVVRIDESCNVLGAEEDNLVIDETKVEAARFKERMERGELAYTSVNTRGDAVDAEEDFRFTVADNPGLISQASENVGLGHSFLRSIERSLALAYVVDFSGPNPEIELQVLHDELEAYKPGLSAKVRVVIANKADLLGESGERDVEAAREKLRRLEKFVHTELTPENVPSPLEVIPISAKYSQNLRKILTSLRKYVEEARQAAYT